MEALPLTVPPVPWENLNGYIRRLCAVNGVANVALFRSALDIGRLSSSTADEAPWLRLAAASLQPLAAIKTMQWRKHESGLLRGLVDFHGQPIQKKFLRTARLRICPRCICDKKIIQDSWSLFYMTACPVHSVKLVDSCDNCFGNQNEPTPLKYTSAAHPWTCHCDREFGEIGSLPASPEALLVAEALENALGSQLRKNSKHADICPEIIALQLNDLMAFVDIVGTAATTPASEDIPDNSLGVAYRHGLVDQSTNLEKCTRRVEAAGQIITTWPVGYQKLLEEIADRNPDAPHHQVDRKAFATKVGSMVLFPRRSVSGVPLKILQDQVDEFCLSSLDLVRRKRNLATQDPRARIVHRTTNMSALARDLGLNSRSSLFQKAYRQVIKEMTLDEAGADAGALISNLQRSVEAHLQRSESSISGTTATVILEGARLDRRLQGWDHPELLQKMPETSDFYGKRKASYSLSETLALRDRFIALAEPVETCASPCILPQTLRIILSEAYKKTDLLIDLLHGQFTLYKEGSPESVFDLFVDIEQLRSFMLQRDLKDAFQTAKFMRLAEINRLAARVGPTPSPLTPADMKLLRDDRRVRFQEDEIFDGRRYHTGYKYHVRDVFEQLLHIAPMTNRGPVLHTLVNGSTSSRLIS